MIIVLVLGFRTFGSPERQRLERADARDVQALAGLAAQINLVWSRSGNVLPLDLDKILFPVVKAGTLTGKPFIYHPKRNGLYDLCATFGTDSREFPNVNAADPWRHPKGDYCFQMDASLTVPQVPYYTYW